MNDLVYVAERNVSAGQRLRPGGIIVATSSGSKHLVGKWGQLQGAWHGSFGAFCAAIRPKPHIDSRYLALFLQSPGYWRRSNAWSATIFFKRRFSSSSSLSRLASFTPIPPYLLRH